MLAGQLALIAAALFAGAAIYINLAEHRRQGPVYRMEYHRTRTHLSLKKDCPHSRPIQPPRNGRVIAIPQVGGLHHRYQRLAA
jgi:putative transposase